MAQTFFISYASEDAAHAREICALLKGLGAAYWIAPESIMPGEPYPVAIAKAIRDSCAMLLLFSRSSDQSDDVMNEVSLARNHKKRVVPVRLENCRPATLEYYLGVPQWIDFYDSRKTEGERQLQQLVADLCGAPVSLGANTSAAVPAVDGASLVPVVASLNPGDRIGSHEVLDVIASGGMGLVYQAREVSSGRMDAIWVMQPEFGGDQGLADLCRNGIQLHAALHHPNITEVYSTLSVGTRPGMIMEYVDGPSTETLLEAAPIPPEKTIHYGAQVLAALAHIHARGVIHRNVKPGTMILAPTGEIKLAGFHVACMRGASRLPDGRVVGSVNYMSPEQIRGEEPDARSDLYSLGVTLFELVTGRCPYTGAGDYAVMQAHLHQEPPPPINLVPSMSRGLNDVIMMALSKTREARFATADAMRRALVPSVRVAQP